MDLESNICLLEDVSNLCTISSGRRDLVGGNCLFKRGEVISSHFCRLLQPVTEASVRADFQRSVEERSVVAMIHGYSADGNRIESMMGLSFSEGLGDEYAYVPASEAGWGGTIDLISKIPLDSLRIDLVAWKGATLEYPTDIRPQIGVEHALRTKANDQESPIVGSYFAMGLPRGILK